MGKWESVKLSSLVAQSITGEWGTECIDATKAINIIRTTNFTNSGAINYDNIALRNISHDKVEKKKLELNDIILEKSGGSENQPVGRVVFFNKIDDGVYLCNNFTQILRLNSKVVIPRYIFLFLLCLYKKGATELLQNKTTGIRNLQLKRYLETEVPLPPLPVQQQIADILDQASALIEKRKAQIVKLDLLVKSQFNEMFGDLISNTHEYEIKRLGEFTAVGSSKRVFVSELVDTGIPFYRGTEVSILSKGMAVEPQLFITRNHYMELKESTGAPKIGDILLPSICSDGQLWLVDTDNPFYFKDGRVLWVHIENKAIDSRYLLYALKVLLTRNYHAIASGTTFAELKIFTLKEIKIPLPPEQLQKQFAAFVQQVEAQKALLQNSLEKMEQNYKSLMQKCFRGEIF